MSDRERQLVVQVLEIVDQAHDVVVHLTRRLAGHRGLLRRIRGRHGRKHEGHERLNGPGRGHRLRHWLINVRISQYFAGFGVSFGVGLFQPLIALLTGVSGRRHGGLLAGCGFLGQLIAPWLLTLTQIILLLEIFGRRFLVASLRAGRFRFVAWLSRCHLLAGRPVLVVAAARGLGLRLGGVVFVLAAAIPPLADSWVRNCGGCGQRVGLLTRRRRLLLLGFLESLLLQGSLLVGALLLAAVEWLVVESFYLLLNRNVC